MDKRIILPISLVLLVGIGIYFWLSSGNDGGLVGGIPKPPALPE